MSVVNGGAQDGADAGACQSYGRVPAGTRAGVEHGRREVQAERVCDVGRAFGILYVESARGTPMPSYVCAIQYVFCPACPERRRVVPPSSRVSAVIIHSFVMP
jgi:hypothetical protein